MGTPISHRLPASEIQARSWRVGHSTGRALYVSPGGDDDTIGMLDTRELAAYVVRCVNEHEGLRAALMRIMARRADDCPHCVAGEALGLPMIHKGGRHPEPADDA